MRVLVTGMNGFIGTNLQTRLSEDSNFDVCGFGRQDDPHILSTYLANVDAVVHPAGENRPGDTELFSRNNADFTGLLCRAISEGGRHIPIVFASSTQAALDNPYGQSKLAAERHVEALAGSGNPSVIYRLPGVFGKWCRPNYNSVVATFCFNIANGLPITVSDPDKDLTLAYIDDVANEITRAIRESPPGLTRGEIRPTYSIKVGELANLVERFSKMRKDLQCDRVGTGLTRALYATYISYLPPDQFGYLIPSHSDPRGQFVEMLKTPDSGQFSYFTAGPGVTRGGHYHHTKTEKFLVIRGTAKFRFKNIRDGRKHEIVTDGATPQVVETIPGWSHDVTNIGSSELIVMLWANEVFDRKLPDTTASGVV